MTTRIIGRTAATVLALLASFPSAAQAKSTATSRAHETVPPAPAACVPDVAPDDLLAYIAVRLQVVDAKLDRFFVIWEANKRPTEAELLELEETMSERETVLQLQKNTLQILLEPAGDMAGRRQHMLAS